MKTSRTGLSLIEHFEGFSPIPYRCPAGLLTIGYGHLMSVDEQRALHEVTQAQAHQLLAADVVMAEHAVARFIRASLTQNQFDALVSFTFNLGAATLQRSTLRQVVNRGEHGGVRTQLMRFVWAGGRKLAGLAARRAAEAALYTS